MNEAEENSEEAREKQRRAVDLIGLASEALQAIGTGLLEDDRPRMASGYASAVVMIAEMLHVCHGRIDPYSGDDEA